MFVSQIIEEVLEILGTTDRPRALRKLTQAVQALMQSGHYYHLNSEVDICTGWDGMTVTLPRGIEVPLAVNVDGSPVYFRGRLFQYSVNKGGMYNPVQWAWDDRGMVATQMDIRQPSQLIAVAENEGDAGKMIRVIGTDANNRDLRAQFDDGTGVDGTLVRVRALSEFPYGTIQPDGITINTRSAAAGPFYVFTVPSSHQFQSGQSVVLSEVNGTIPPELKLQQRYYVGVINIYDFSLHQNELDAIGGVNPILLSSVWTLIELNFTDSRRVSLYTGLTIPSVPVVTIDKPNSVTFSRIGSFALPSPLVEDTVYFAKEIYDSNNSPIFPSVGFELYNTASDAINGSNIISLTGATTSAARAILYLRKVMTAQTKLEFTVSSGYSSGDIVQANTSGGTLPQPLVVGQNYYVHVLPGDPAPISLHYNYAESLTGDNPINLTTPGSGNNSVAKLLEATASPGTKNNITTNGFVLPAPLGQGASIRALASGPLTSTFFITQGSGYTSASATLSDLGGYNYTSAPSIQLVGGAFTTAAQLTAVMATTAVQGGTMLYVSEVTIVNAGSGYTSSNLPRVVFSGGLGTGGVHARAQLLINGAGQVTGLAFLPYGTGALVSVGVNTISKVPNSITIIQAGSGYVYPPRLTISAPNIDPPLTSVTSHSVTTGSKTFVVNLPNTSSSIVVGQTVRASSTLNSLNFVEGAVTGFSGTNLTINVTVTGGSGTNLTSWSIALATDPALTQCVGGVGITTSFIADYIVENGGRDYQSPPALKISGGAGSGAVANAVLDRYGVGVINVLTGGAGYSTSSTAIISDSAGGTGSGATATVQVLGGVIQTITVTNCGSGYSNPTITISPAPTTLATFSFEFTSVVVDVEPIAQGSEYVVSPIVSVIASTGVFIQFSSTGTLPAPLVQGASYRAEYPKTGNSFTVQNADFSDVNITSTGSGEFYVVLSYSFSIGFTGIWNGDFAGITTNAVRVQADFDLPTTVPPLSPTTTYYLKKITNTSARLYTDSGATLPVEVTGFGIGQTYFALPYNATATCFNNELNIENINYLRTGDYVDFSGQDNLPSPLNYTSTYTVTVSGSRITLMENATGIDVDFTDLGINSNILMIIQRLAESKPSFEITSENCSLNTGDKITVRPKPGDSLPQPLIPIVPGPIEPLYVRRTGANSFLLFYSRNNALDNVNPIQFYSVGDTLSSTFYTDLITEPTLVKAIYHVEKPVTIGYVSLYAFDHGRSNDMALIGQYHPSETNPKYRRVRIGKPCAWVRMIYRVRAPEITSEYDYIPVENPRAIIAAVHAVDLEDKDFLEQAQKYWQVASAYLRNENESMDGHAMQTPQINNLTFGDGSDPVMF
jgi:hypothetical protein